MENEQLAVLAFMPEAHDSAAAFLNLLTGHHRTRAKVGSLYVPVANDDVSDDQGYCVHVICADGAEFDAEVRDVTVDENDGQYKLVLWEWEDDADRGDPDKEHVLDIYDDLVRVEVW